MKQIITRFAPSPTGFMHIGNIRVALINYLFAKQKKGFFILRIEDTDASRNCDNKAEQILRDLSWMNIHFDEGPHKPGSLGPYFQSERHSIYQKYLSILLRENFIYQCFCSEETLEQKKEAQIKAQKAPRYDETCAHLTTKEIEEEEKKETPFVWRIRINKQEAISFYDLSKGIIKFDLQHFSDFSITRKDGSFTFIFANTIDDIEMKISHVIRGEDHLTNTVKQIYIMQLLKIEQPIFWHLPILCNKSGKKLSKRDAGFSLLDLQKEGFLPQAIEQYIISLSSSSFSFHNQLIRRDQFIENGEFSLKTTQNQTHYDIDVLKKINHRWLQEENEQLLADKCKIYLEQQGCTITSSELLKILPFIISSMQTINDCYKLLYFYFHETSITLSMLTQITTKENIEQIITTIVKILEENIVISPEEIKERICAILCTPPFNIQKKEIFTIYRIIMTGAEKGLSMVEIASILNNKKQHERLLFVLNLINQEK